MSDKKVTLYADALAVGFAEYERRLQEELRPKDYAFVYGLTAYLRAAQSHSDPGSEGNSPNQEKSQ